MGVQQPMDVDPEEEGMETDQAAELCDPRPESESAMSMSSYTHAPTIVYSIAVSSSHIKSVPTQTTGLVNTISNCNAIFLNTAIYLSAFGQGPHASGTRPQ